MAYPLDGVRSWTCAASLAGPFAGRMLADLGADVVKVEPPEGRAPHVRQAARSAYFLRQNTNKRSSPSTSRPRRAGLVLRLAARPTSLVENFRPGVMARSGSVGALSALNPRLVILSITGFGQDGPERDRAAYTHVIHAETGSCPPTTPAGRLPLDTECAGRLRRRLHRVAGVLAALRLRDALGGGQQVDIATLEALAFSDDYLPGEVARRRRSRAPTAAGDRQPPTTPVPTTCGRAPTRSRRARSTSDGRVQAGSRSDRRPAGVSPTRATGRALGDKVAARRLAWRDYTSFDPHGAAAALDQAGLAWVIVARGADRGRRRRSPPADLVQTDDPEGPDAAVRAPYRFSAGEAGVRAGRAPARASTAWRSSPTGSADPHPSTWCRPSTACGPGPRRRTPVAPRTRVTRPSTCVHPSTRGGPGPRRRTRVAPRTRWVRCRRTCGSGRAPGGAGAAYASSPGRSSNGRGEDVEQPLERLEVAVGGGGQRFLDEVVAGDVHRVDAVHRRGDRVGRAAVGGQRGPPPRDPGVERGRLGEQGPDRPGSPATADDSARKHDVWSTRWACSSPSRSPASGGVAGARRAGRAWPACPRASAAGSGRRTTAAPPWPAPTAGSSSSPNSGSIASASRARFQWAMRGWLP